MFEVIQASFSLVLFHWTGYVCSFAITQFSTYVFIYSLSQIFSFSTFQFFRFCRTSMHLCLFISPCLQGLGSVFIRDFVRCPWFGRCDLVNCPRSLLTGTGLGVRFVPELLYWLAYPHRSFPWRITVFGMWTWWYADACLETRSCTLINAPLEHCSKAVEQFFCKKPAWIKR